VTGRRPAPSPPSADQFVQWGIDPAWSRLVDVPDGLGGSHRWHVLEHGPGQATVTVVCVHGNPTWSYLWTSFLRRLGDRYRVVAPDQLGMGYSERTPARRYRDRIADLDRLVDALGIDTPIVLAAHDWGGAIAMGWAVEHPDRVAALVLANTGIAVPEGRSAPAIIRLAATRGIHDLVTRRTSTFVRGTTRLSRRQLSAVQCEAFAAPYPRAGDRGAIGDFVADIPFTTDHPSATDIAHVADRLGELDIPVLLAWGAADPVFGDDFADDLAARFRRADIHRFAQAGHLVVAELDVAGVADEWLRDRLDAQVPQTLAPSGDGDQRPLWAGLEERATDPLTAELVAFHDGATGRSVSFAELWRMVTGVASALRARGVQPGDRVAVLVPPSIELVAVVYAIWRIGAVTVIADRGLGLRGLGRAVRSARVDAVLGPRRALAAARTLRWAPGATRIELADVTPDGATAGAGPVAGLPDVPDVDAPAAVLFTSGATGPAKGVRYTHGQLAAQRSALTECYRIVPGDRFVAAFAPFALFGPALGIASAIPDVDVTRPGRLTASALDASCRAIDATMVFASPAALANVVATAEGDLVGLAAIRVVMSAGAPVPVRTLRAVARLTPRATLHTPYGMTEVLPVADIDLTEIVEVGPGRGVCVGRPVANCEVMIAPLDLDASRPVEAVPTATTGEVLVRSAWMSAGYDRLWRTERAARPRDPDGAVWHRSGDVGHVDEHGRLWIEGRSVHVIRSVRGPVTPVPVEVAVETLDEVRRAAAVGVGPAGVQQVVVVIEVDGAGDGLADEELTARVRAVVPDHDVAAVCTTTSLPVDIRHNAKIDRAEVAEWAGRLLAGGRP
jgi:olefin beta-lactone synthetase